MPNTWCRGLITPIYKSGGRNEPSNNRRNNPAVWEKIFCSILNQRLLEHVNALILHNSQIGFLPTNRIVDHVLTLRTLVDKYVHRNNEKMYACSVDFKNVLESLWHDGLLFSYYKLMSVAVFFLLF